MNHPISLNIDRFDQRDAEPAALDDLAADGDSVAADDNALTPRGRKVHALGWQPKAELRKKIDTMQIAFPLKSLGEEAAMNLLLGARQAGDAPTRHAINTIREAFTPKQSATEADGHYDALSKDLVSLKPVLSDLTNTASETRALAAGLAAAHAPAFEALGQTVAEALNKLSDEIRKEQRREREQRAEEVAQLVGQNELLMDAVRQLGAQRQALADLLKELTQDVATQSLETSQLSENVLKVKDDLLKDATALRTDLSNAHSDYNDQVRFIASALRSLEARNR